MMVVMSVVRLATAAKIATMVKTGASVNGSTAVEVGTSVEASTSVKAGASIEATAGASLEMTSPSVTTGTGQRAVRKRARRDKPD